MKRLFTTREVKKFFSILSRMGRSCEDRYETEKGHKPCEKEVFVRRALKKFDGKCFRQFEVVETGLYTYDKVGFGNSKPVTREQVRIIAIGRPRFVLGHGTEIEVSFWDATKPSQYFQSLRISHNQALRLVAEEIQKEDYNEINKMFIAPEVKCKGCDKVVKHTDIGEDGTAECNTCENDRYVKEIKAEMKKAKRKKKSKK